MIGHLGTNRETIQVNMLGASKLTRVHQSMWFSEVHNSVKLDMCSLDWDDTRYQIPELGVAVLEKQAE